MFNLLPWRENLRQHKFKQIILAIIFGFILLVMLISIWGYKLTLQINKQTALINKLKNRLIAIRPAPKLLAEYKQLDNLQHRSLFASKLFKLLMYSVPAGVLLTKITKQAEQVIILGRTSSQAKLSEFLHILAQTDYLQNPVLQHLTGQEFKITCDAK